MRTAVFPRTLRLRGDGRVANDVKSLVARAFDFKRNDTKYLKDEYGLDSRVRRAKLIVDSG